VFFSFTQIWIFYKEYETIYNEQSGLYEIELEAPDAGGVYNAAITFKDSNLAFNTSSSAASLISDTPSGNLNMFCFFISIYC